MLYVLIKKQKKKIDLSYLVSLSKFKERNVRRDCVCCQISFVKKKQKKNDVAL